MYRILTVCCLLSLAGCAGVAATATKARLSSDQLVTLQRTCAAVRPAVDAAIAGPEKVSSIAEYAKAYCDQLLAGAVPPTTDANTPRWLDITLRGLGIAAKAAGFLLPLVL